MKKKDQDKQKHFLEKVEYKNIAVQWTSSLKWRSWSAGVEDNCLIRSRSWNITYFSV